MMPKDCKRNRYLLPVYDRYSFGYCNRRDIDCNPEHIQLIWNCGTLQRPCTHEGIMALESKNTLLNQWKWKLGSQGIVKAYLNSFLFLLNSHVITNNYWKTETDKEISKRQQSGYQTWIEMYPDQFDRIERIIVSLRNLTFLTQSPYYDKEGNVRMTTIIDCNEKELKATVYNMIRRNGLKFTKTKGNKEGWTERHNLDLFCLLQENEWFSIDEKLLKEIKKYFHGKFEIDYLWMRCKSFGAKYVDKN